jgi:hypothetical protein
MFFSKLLLLLGHECVCGQLQQTAVVLVTSQQAASGTKSQTVGRRIIAAAAFQAAHQSTPQIL